METKHITPSKEFQQRLVYTLPRAIFHPLVRAPKLPRGVSMTIETELDIKPWPTEPAEEAPAEPPVFRKTLSFKLKEKKEDKRDFKRAMRRACKIPRKLKKACRHIYLPNSNPTIYDVVTMPDGTVCGIGYVSGYRIKPGYPHTKWARKALAKINRSVERSIKELFKNNEKPCHNT